MHRIIIYNTFVFDKCSFEHLYSDYFVSVKMQSCLFCLLSKVCRNARCTSFLFITIQICSFSLSCDLLKISLIYAAGGENKTFIGSADWMPRNLDNRVEVITPVYDSRIKEDLWKVIDFGLRGNCQGSVVDGSGKNCLWTTDTEESFRSQEELYKYYKSHITND